MTLSSFTAWSQITEGADAAPDTFNNPLSVISQNLDQLNTDAASNLSTSQVTIGDTLSVDTIVEYTSANGVTIDGVLIRDSAISTDNIYETTAATGVTIDGVLVKDSEVSASGLSASHLTANNASISQLTVTGTIKVDNITEEVSDAGVTIESFLVKSGAFFGVNGKFDISASLVWVGANSQDTNRELRIATLGGSNKDSILAFQEAGADRGDIRWVGSTNLFEWNDPVGGGVGFPSKIRADNISEYTSGNGVTIDGVLLRDSAISTDNIYETTAAAGVTIDSVLLKDSDVSASEIVLSGNTAALRGTHTPASGTDSGETGDITWDTDFVYVCVSTDSWARAALSRF